MTDSNTRPSLWAKLPVLLRAIVAGLLIGLTAANLWTVFLFTLGVPLAALVEVAFLTLYVWWAAGGGPPHSTQSARANSFRRSKLSAAQWCWGLVAALFFAATVHASIVLLFRLVPFPVEAFRRGYDLSIIPSIPLRWLTVIISAASAGICEETGFRGYMQRPIEQRHGAASAIFVSSLFFWAVHLTKAWSTPGMVPIVFGAGVLLGLLAWSAQSLIPGMIAHTLMDIGLFAYWWTGLAGTFTARPSSETGADGAFLIAIAVFAASLLIVLLAISRLRQSRRSSGASTGESSLA
jgi:membrane protease YdiL (CAAX protease family)